MINAISSSPFPTTPQRPVTAVPPQPAPTNTVNVIQPASQPPQRKSNLPKILLGVLLLVILVVGGGATYYLTQQQQDLRQDASDGTIGKAEPTPIATQSPERPPTTPTPSPTFTPTDTAQCTKYAFGDTGGASIPTGALTNKSSFNSSEGIIFKIDVKAQEEILPLKITDNLKPFTDVGAIYLGSTTTGGACENNGTFDEQTGIFTCNWLDAADRKTLSIFIRMKFPDSLIQPEKIKATNTAKVGPCELCNADRPAGQQTSTPGSTTKLTDQVGEQEAFVPGSVSCSINVEIPGTTGNTDTLLSCNAQCTPAVDAQGNRDESVANDPCSKAMGPNYVCHQIFERPEPGTTGNVCRLRTNIDSQTCAAPAGPTATPTPRPTSSSQPTLGCNQTCSTNSDCTNSTHICATINDGSKRCRLADNVNSTSCSSPSATSQPTLPAELPQTGAEDWGTWLKAGLGALGLGVVVLLLL